MPVRIPGSLFPETLGHGPVAYFGELRAMDRYAKRLSVNRQLSRTFLMLEQDRH